MDRILEKILQCHDSLRLPEDLRFASTNSSREVLHFEEEGRKSPTCNGDRMSEEDYSAALDNLVITCVDVVLTLEGKVLLGKRNVYPRKTWWVIGGRMLPGEEPIYAAKRKLIDEAGIDIDVFRLKYIGCYSTCFAFRQQEPQRNGSHTLNLTYQLELKKHESQIELKNSEYETSRWFEIREIVDLLDPNNQLDKALLQVVKDLQFSHSTT